MQEYVSGENCRFLGRNYRLKVVQSSEESVKLKGGYLNLSVKDKDNFKRKEHLIKQWYFEKAENHIKKAFNKYQPIVNKEVKSVRIRKMKTRWGSCNPAKSYINLNSELIKSSIQCIEYVVFHELTHLIYPNHDESFYNYLSLHMPNWKIVKQNLENCC
ncbi:Putative predicted metal-dependent hydrolase [uncultured Candidatus Thioglobus sp.]|nr:Putative predicted metal-dependent hydrolase [uncultured Candidatus Thioglobus sp.]